MVSEMINVNNTIQLNHMQQKILELLSITLHNSDNISKQNIDWEAIYNECKKQTVQIIAWRGLKSSLLPNDIREKWKKTVIASIYNNYQITWAHLEIHEIMKNNEIPYVILKGCASALYYPEPLDRIMRDVDFLVDLRDLKRAGNALMENGFVPYDSEERYHIGYIKGNIHVEMHFEAPGVPKGKEGKSIKQYLSNIIEDAQTVKVEGKELRVPSKFHHGLVLLLHTCQHLIGEGIGLRHLCDWGVFASSMSSSEFCNIFEKKLKSVGLWRFARILTQTSIDYLKSPYENWVGKNESILTLGIIQDIFNAGNFGRKDTKRWYVSYFISNRGKKTIANRSLIGQFFSSMNEIVFQNNPYLKKCPILITFGWLFYGIRYLIRMKQGIRPVLKPKYLVENAVLRRNLYRQLELFKKE